ncbi:hypothetical protein CDL12_19281 [Handroanthus impetiginosus]|uniref:Uncharacterized protein n=1 Tax=Handroanthus impetiginosus TaxID=429701 RepID=A0A2G9GSB1_9LAMI|nr:hypothetical protein CDL12_19281 [Handroanthus impetiginosus]
MAALTRRIMFNLSSRRISRIFSFNYSSQDSSQAHYITLSLTILTTINTRELFRTGEGGESHKSNESVRDVGNRAYEMTEKVKESMQNSAVKTGKMGQIRDSGSENKESVVEDLVDDEDELKKKPKKEAGRKPVDEDKGLDVNWRPIDENKPSSL